jgi:hypothetical protein
MTRNIWEELDRRPRAQGTPGRWLELNRSTHATRLQLLHELAEGPIEDRPRVRVRFGLASGQLDRPRTGVAHICQDGRPILLARRNSPGGVTLNAGLKPDLIEVKRGNRWVELWRACPLVHHDATLDDLTVPEFAAADQLAHLGLPVRRAVELAVLLGGPLTGAGLALVEALRDGGAELDEIADALNGLNLAAA